MRTEEDISKLKGKVDFGIITVREDEYLAVLQRLRPERMVSGRQTYSLTRLRTTNEGEYLIACVRCVEQGTSEGQKVASNLIEDLDPTWILLVGIAGSVPDYEYTLGDVVLATRLHDFSVSASIEDASGQAKQQFSVKGGPMHPDIQKLLGALPALEMFFEPWNTPEAISIPRPQVSPAAKYFYGDADWKSKIRECLKRYFGTKSIRQDPKAFTGAIASSDTLVKNTQLTQKWLETTRHITGIEMELAGVYQAAWNAQKPILAIRGISDVVGYKRSPDWTDYACHTAAAFTLSLLRSHPLTPRLVKAETTAEVELVNTPPTTGVFSSRPVDPQPLQKRESLYTNLLELTYVPKDIYSVRTHCKNRGHVWTLLNNETPNTPNDWIYKGHSIYSFRDFSEPYWKNVCEVETAEPNLTTRWSESNNNERLAEYIELLKGCLRELCLTRDILYRHKMPLRFFYYAPTEDFSPRIVNTRSLVRSTGKHTVFQAYTHTKTGEVRYYRHHAFKFDYYRFAGQWYLEITPTYHYTNDGVRKYRYYEKEISGIKRRENNEAVFRQVLFWAEVLRNDESNFLQQESSYPYLRFGNLLDFTFPYGVPDEVWKKKDPKIVEGDSLFTY